MLQWAKSGQFRTVAQNLYKVRTPNLKSPKFRMCTEKSVRLATLTFTPFNK